MRIYVIVAVVGLCGLGSYLSTAQAPTKTGRSVPESLIQCPAEITILDTPESPAGWEHRVGRRKVTLRGASIIQQRDNLEGDLAPSTEDVKGTAVKQEWRLAPYRDGKLMLRCYYRQTDASLTVRLSNDVERCSVSFHANAKGQPTDTPQISCK